MDLKEFLAAKRQLERDLAAVVQKSISEFETATGLTPDDVSIYLEQVTTHGPQGLERRRVVGRVRVSVPLE